MAEADDGNVHATTFFYSQSRRVLPARLMKQIANSFGKNSRTRKKARITSRGDTVTYRWPDLKLQVIVATRDEYAWHSMYLENSIVLFVGADVSGRGLRILRRLRKTRLMVFMTAEPDCDKEGRSRELMDRINRAIRPIVETGNELYDHKMRFLLRTDGSFDPEAEIE